MFIIKLDNMPNSITYSIQLYNTRNPFSNYSPPGIAKLGY